MNPLDDKDDEELLRSLLAEAAKARNELKCSQGDVEKAQNRLSFVLMLINELLNRKN